MWIRVLLQPWWLRTAYVAFWLLVTVFVVMSLIRFEHNINPNPFSLPVPAIAIMLLACVSLAGLFAALLGRRRDRYRQALQGMSPADRSKAIAAAWRGPAPDNAHLRGAAGQLAWLHLSAYRKNRTASLVSYPLLVIIWLASAIDNWFDHEFHRAIVSAIFAAGMLVGLTWMWLARRCWQARVALLAPSLLQR